MKKLKAKVKYVTTTRVARHDMVVVQNLVQENEETEGKGNEEDGEKSQDGEERQKHLEIFSVFFNVMKYSTGTLKNIAKNVL